MKFLHYHENYNGILLNDAFCFIRPEVEGFTIGDDIQVMLKNEFAGYAVVKYVGKNVFGSINEFMAMACFAKPLPWVRTTLSRQFGFTDKNPIIPNFPILFGIAQWTERHMPIQTNLFTHWYEKAKEKHTNAYEAEKMQSSLFNI